MQLLKMLCLLLYLEDMGSGHQHEQLNLKHTLFVC